MLRTMRRPVLLLPMLWLACASRPTTDGPAAATDSLRVHGALPAARTLTTTELEAFGGEDVAWTFRDQAHTYRALPLDVLLQQLGFDEGQGGKTVAPQNRRPGWRSVLIARARDGFFAVFTLAELMPDMGPSRAYVAWRCDGAPLAADEGPLRLVVPTDRKGSRAVRMLHELEVVDLRSLMPTPASR